MDWRYVGLKVGVRLVIWSLIVAPAVGCAVLTRTFNAIGFLVWTTFATAVGAGLAEVVLARLGVASRADAPSNPNAARPKG